MSYNNIDSIKSIDSRESTDGTETTNTTNQRPDNIRRESDTILLEKLQSLQKIINEADPNDIFDSSYSYEEFCQDLDVEDVYTRRLLELLIQETAGKRQQSDISPRGTVDVTANPSARPRRVDDTKEPNYIVRNVYSNGVVRNR